jgi:hypothetical protein
MFCGSCGHPANGGETTVVDVGGATQVGSASLTRAEADSLIDQQVAERREDLAMSARRLTNAIEPQAIVVCIDTSSSTSEPAANNLTRLEAECLAIKGMAREGAEAAPSSQICSVDFNGDARIDLPWTPLGGAMPKLREVLLKLKSEGGTKFNPPLKLAYEMFKQAPQGLKPKLLFLSDGWNQDFLSLKFGPLHAMGVEVETLGFAEKPSDVNESALKQIATERDGDKLYRFAGDPSVLVKAVLTSLH